MFKTIWSKIVFAVMGVLLLGLVVLNIKGCMDMKAQREALQEQTIEMKRLSEDVVQSQSRYASREDIQKIIEENMDLDEIKEELDRHNAKIDGIQTILVSSIGRKQTDVGSGWVKPRPQDPNGSVPTCQDGSECEDQYGYWENSQYLGLSEPFSNGTDVPIGSVGFEAWKEKPWTVNVLPRDYHVTTVLGKDKRGRQYTYNKFEIGVDGKKYPVEIDSSQVLQELPEASFSWWNPRIGIGAHGGAGFNTNDDSILTGVAGATISFSPFSYGQLESKPDWIFGRVGAGIDAVHRTATFSVAPAMWNIGSATEVIQNTYLGPVMSVDHEGRIGVGVGVTTDF